MATSIVSPMERDNPRPSPKSKIEIFGRVSGRDIPSVIGRPELQVMLHDFFNGGGKINKLSAKESTTVDKKTIFNRWTRAKRKEN